MATNKEILCIDELKVFYETKRGSVKAVDGVSFNIYSREAFGLAGESGCGKSTTAYAIMRLVPPPGRIVSGHIYWMGKDILNFDDEELRRYRWKEVSMVFQSAMNALNPVMTIGNQIAEAILNHENVSKDEAFKRAEELLELVGISKDRVNDYPHEFSGGMRQRAVIAMALACNPKLVIADEPVTALDVIVQAQILDVLRNLKNKLNLSILLITHDLSVIADICDRAAIMYAGKIVELGSVYDIFNNPLHPYTQLLTKSFPRLKGERRGIEYIPGAPPNLINPPKGCRFHPRCPYVKDVCREREPKYIEVDGGHYVACHLVK